MSDLFPYISGDYFSEKYGPHQLKLTEEIINKTQPRHFRDEIEYLYIIEGTGKLEINQLMTTVQTGDFIQLMPYHVHRFIIGNGESLKVFKLRFSIGLLLYISVNQQNYLKSIQKIDQALPIVSLNKRARTQLIFLCSEVIEEESHSPNSVETLHLSLVAFLSYLYSNHQNRLEKKEVKQHLSWLVLQYIHMHHQEQITVRRVSFALGISEQEVKSAIKSLTGFSFQKTLNQIRIRNAAALTQFQELSLNQIGKICGFQSESNFYKVFKELQGISPNEYREQYFNAQTFHNDTWEIILYLVEHCCEDLSLTELSHALNFSEKKINTLLNQQYQQTFKEFLNSFRVMIAKNLLIYTTIPIKDIAQQIGFKDSLTFSRNFEKVYKETPKKYLENNQHTLFDVSN